jgi:hypothetical protein
MSFFRQLLQATHHNRTSSDMAGSMAHHASLPHCKKTQRRASHQPLTPESKVKHFLREIYLQGKIFHSQEAEPTWYELRITPEFRFHFTFLPIFVQ